MREPYEQPELVLELDDGWHDIMTLSAGGESGDLEDAEWGDF